MLNSELKLVANIFEKPDMASTREGFGKGVVEAGKADERVVVLTADLAESTNAHHFQKAYPERFIQVGVAEQNLATVAAGMANYGKIPFITSYAVFNPGRNWEQIRTTIALNNVPVIVCGMHVGLQTGADGATHQALEDLALMRSLPRFTVISACDAEEGRKATIAAARLGSPVYMRWSREKTPTMTTAETPFEIGKAQVFWNPPADGGAPQAVIFGTGPVLHNALLAARALKDEGVAVTVVNVHTIKPLDKETVLREAGAAGCVVTVEEHQIAGGLGGAIAELLASERPIPMEFIGMQDKFGQSGTSAELLKHYGLDVPHIIEAVKKAVSRRP
ncbi:transketolase family protein [Candidatus Kaiserbacteria bacterium]|nr:transketolase family protein [Candidatus Kaiserbacteria bacterium]